MRQAYDADLADAERPAAPPSRPAAAPMPSRSHANNGGGYAYSSGSSSEFVHMPCACGKKHRCKVTNLDP